MTEADPPPTPAVSTAKLRIDKWLWQARFFKSRTLATKLVSSGGVRVNRVPIRKANQMVGPGDVLTFPQGRAIRVIEIVALGERRGPASEAQALYADLAPPDAGPGEPHPDRPGLDGERESGAGRPTKRDRRATDRLKAPDWI